LICICITWNRPVSKHIYKITDVARGVVLFARRNPDEGGVDGEEPDDLYTPKNIDDWDWVADELKIL
jgi:hypothetical protein